jgi:uncharacterized OsmC-like protein
MLRALEYLAALFIFLIGIGVLIVIFTFIADISQTKQAIRRNYPVIGHFRYFFENLGACTSMTLRLYARHKNLRLHRVSVRLRHQKIHAQDCADCATRTGRLDQIEREISLDGDLDEAQRQRLLGIADRCPVHRTLLSEIRIVSRLTRIGTGSR